MKYLSHELKRFLVFIAVTIIISTGYYLYVSSVYEPGPEKETFLSEAGEEVGEIGLWLLIFIYSRTAIKLLTGKGALSKRLIPQYSPSFDSTLFQNVTGFLDRTHLFFGVTTIVVILLHIVLSGIPMHILFFPAVLLLIIWQGLFGAFISWKYSPKEVKKFSYLVHAQLFTGVLIGVFAYFGHIFIDN